MNWRKKQTDVGPSSVRTKIFNWLNESVHKKCFKSYQMARSNRGLSVHKPEMKNFRTKVNQSKRKYNKIEIQNTEAFYFEMNKKKILQSTGALHDRFRPSLRMDWSPLQ